MKKEQNVYAAFEQTQEVIRKIIDPARSEVLSYGGIQYQITEKQFNWLMSVYQRELYKSLPKGVDVPHLDMVGVTDVETGKTFTFGYKQRHRIKPRWMKDQENGHRYHITLA